MAVSSGVILGTAFLQTVDGDTILCSTTSSLNITNAEIETTCKDNNGAYTSVPGQQKWQIQIAGNVVFDNAYGLKDLNPLVKNGTTFTVTFGTENVDDPFWQGDGFISNFDQGADQNNPATWSITISPRGPIYLLNT